MALHLIQRNSDETKRLIYEYILDVTYYHKEEWNIIWIDEFSKNVHVNAHYAFSPLGIPKVRTT